ncbi:cation:proton antiporter [Actinocorallia longicatena]
MTDPVLGTFVAITAAAALAPLLADGVQRWIRIPSVVLEILLGILIGPALLGWAAQGTVVDAISDFGLAMLMFLAGYEIDFQRVKGSPLKRAVQGWAVSLALGLGAGLLLRGATFSGLVVGLALTTTALGTTLPMVRDAGLLPTGFGARVLAVGALGEFGPILAVAILLTDDHPVRTIVLIVLFAVIALLGAWAAMRPRPPKISRMIVETLGTSAQLAVRLVMLLVVVMLWIADAFGLDVLLGAFSAGIIIRLAISAAGEEVVETIESKLDGIGYGFLIPFFFVMSGVKFDLEALIDEPVTLLTIPVVLVLFLLVRGAPTHLLNRDDPRRVPLALFASSALPLVVVITGIGVDSGDLKPSIAAAMIAAGMLSVLIYPLIALKRLRVASDG